MPTPTRTRRTALTLLALPAAALLLASCTPDTTRGRVEHDISATFSNQYQQAEQLKGAARKPIHIASDECHSGLNKTADQGPGSWHCQIGYTTPDGQQHSEGYVVLIDALGCYQAFNDANRDGTIKTTAGKTVPDPALSFDGCYNVYDDRTNTSKS
jgi:hypothetical protein